MLIAAEMTRQLDPVVAHFNHKELKDLSSYKRLEKTGCIVGHTGRLGTVLREQLLDIGLFEKVVLIGRKERELPDDPERYARCVSFFFVDVHFFLIIHLFHDLLFSLNFL